MPTSSARARGRSASWRNDGHKWFSRGSLIRIARIIQYPPRLCQSVTRSATILIGITRSGADFSLSARSDMAGRLMVFEINRLSWAGLKDGEHNSRHNRRIAIIFSTTSVPLLLLVGETMRRNRCFRRVDFATLDVDVQSGRKQKKADPQPPVQESISPKRGPSPNRKSRPTSLKRKSPGVR